MPKYTYKSAFILGNYRYELRRSWEGLGVGTVVFIGLNPSTADGNEDDATIRKCVAFAQRWGCRQLIMLNLFAYRATHPDAMLRAADPVGRYNDDYILENCRQGVAFRVVAAWGNDGKHLGRDQEVLKLLQSKRIPVYHLGFNANGTPKHPLYLKSDTEPQLLDIPEAA